MKDQQEKAPEYAIEIRANGIYHFQIIKDQDDMNILLELLKKIERNASKKLQPSK